MLENRASVSMRDSLFEVRKMSERTRKWNESSNLRIMLFGTTMFLATSLMVFGTVASFATQQAPTITYSPAFNLSNDNGNAIFPMDANSGSHVYVVWTEGSRGIFFRSSPDNGTTWNPPLTSPPLKLNSGNLGTQYPVISANGSNVYVTWTNGITGGSPQLFFAVSTNYGISFASAKQITTGVNGTITPVISSYGNAVYVGYDQDAQSYAIASSNNGTTWSSPFHVSSYHEPQVYASPESGVIISDAGGLAVTTNVGSSWKSFHLKGCCGAEPWVWGNGPNVYIAWETKGNMSKVYYAYSHNYGQSWSSSTLLSTTITDAWGPKIAAYGNTVVITVTVHPDSGSAQNYIYVSNNAGVSWTGPISESGTAVDIGTSLNVYAYGSDIFAIWGRESSRGTWVTYGTYSTDNGTTWVSPPGINISNNPSGVAANANDVSTGWVVNFGTAAFATWQYQSTTGAKSQIYFAST
jgi:hypothetical protein